MPSGLERRSTFQPFAARLLGLLIAAAPVGCIDPGPAPAASRSADPAPIALHVAVLPNNVTIQAGRNRLLALETGQIRWELRLPEDDVIVAPIAVALNSVAYVRGNRALYAAQPDGKWVWSSPIEGRSFYKTLAADSPVALSDSTVAFVVADNIIRLDHQGNVRWRVPVPEGHVSGALVASMDGSLIAPTTAGLVSVNPDGQVAWRRSLEP